MLELIPAICVNLDLTSGCRLQKKKYSDISDSGWGDEK